MTPPHVFLVFPPGVESIGGAEKRLAGFWYRTAITGQRNITLVGRSAFFERLRAAEEFPRFDELESNRVVIPSASKLEFAKLLGSLRLRSLKSLFHFVNEPPLPWAPVFARGQTILSLTEASLANYSKKGLAMTLTGCLNSSAIDILDPDVANRFRSWLPMSRISTTPGSFIDLDFFKAPPATEKKNALVFLGTFIEVKQVSRLLATLPTLQAELTKRGHRALTFYFLGRDTQGRSLADQAKGFRDSVDLRIFFADRPSEVLREAKVFFSVQRTENYPSKSLLEAMACGCLPVVTDVGKSRLIARDEFAQFVPQDFTAHDLVEACDRILSLEAPAFDRKVGLARDFMAETFSFEAMSSYFQNLYTTVARRE